MTPNEELPHAHHFESYAHQSQAARLGMWLFLASELMLFAGLFALYAAYRVSYPEAFAAGIVHGDKVLGTANTAILLVSSYFVAMSIHYLEEGRGRAAIVALLVTELLALEFLVNKGIEYAHHFEEGIFPGLAGPEMPHGAALFNTLYFLMTGLHALHVLGGMTLLGVMALRIRRGTLTPRAHHPLELSGLYWHLVDLIWIFLWPLFYLTGGGSL